jgi:SOS-response transcriptional repressor LexA
MREKNTKKQQELLQFITDFLTEHNYAPSYREIMTALGYKSVSTVAVHVNGLVGKGYLTKSDKSARSVRLSVEVKPDDDHTAWLRTEIRRREAAGADTKQLDVLRHAVEIVEGADD